MITLHVKKQICQFCAGNNPAVQLARSLITDWSYASMACVKAMVSIVSLPLARGIPVRTFLSEPILISAVIAADGMHTPGRNPSPQSFPSQISRSAGSSFPQPSAVNSKKRAHPEPTLDELSALAAHVGHDASFGGRTQIHRAAKVRPLKGELSSHWHPTTERFPS